MMWIAFVSSYDCHHHFCPYDSPIAGTFGSEQYIVYYVVH